jgi:adenylate kinase
MNRNANGRKRPPLILLGAPGAGKGTQARIISNILWIPHISTGAILRQNIQQGSPLGRLSMCFMEKGELVPDDVVNKMMRERLRQPDCGSGFLLDGYPRTVAQAEDFREIVREIGQLSPVVVNLRVRYEVIVKRLSGRWSCPACQRTYHLGSQPPLRTGICDADETALEQRRDDREDTIAERLAAYQRQTAPLVDFYRNGGVVLEVDGERSPEAVSTELSGLLATV